MKKPISTAQKWTRIIIMTIGIVTALGFILLEPLVKTMMKRDRLSGQRQESVAVVENLVKERFDEWGRRLAPQVLVRFHGALIPSDGVFGIDRLEVGQQALIGYRVGKSGKIYIDSVQPLPGNSPPVAQ